MVENDVILSAKEIKRDFETATSTVSVLKGVNIDLNTKETASITGASGVGKSTLLHILGGLDKPTSGQVSLAGEALQTKSEQELARFRNKKVGFIFQFHYLLEDFSALENVMIPMLVADKSKSDAKRNAERLLELVGLKDRAEHRSSQLSGGEQQRVAVARALANDPQLVLADEPSGNLDIDTGRKLHELMMQLNEEENITFLIATHNQELSQLCRRHFTIDDGKIIEC